MTGQFLVRKSGDLTPKLGNLALLQTFHRRDILGFTLLIFGLPSKRETLNQCWVDVDPASTTLVQHQPSIVSTSCVYWVGLYYCNPSFHNAPIYMCVLPSLHETLAQCWVDVDPSSTTLVQHQPSIVSTSCVYWVGLYYCHSSFHNGPILAVKLTGDFSVNFKPIYLKFCIGHFLLKS